MGGVKGMINIILNKVIENLDYFPEQWYLCEYDGVRYASRYMEVGGDTIEVYDNRIEYMGGMKYTLDIPEDLRGKIKEALDDFSVKERMNERILAEQEIFKAISDW